MTANRNRDAGHAWERECVNDLKENTAPHEWHTTREVSRYLDAKGIDIVTEPRSTDITFQCKNTTSCVNYHKLMEGKDKNHIILHKLTKKSESGRFLPQAKYAVISYELLLELLKDRLT